MKTPEQRFITNLNHMAFSPCSTNEYRNTFELIIIFLLKREYVERNNININKGYTERKFLFAPTCERKSKIK